MGNDTNNKDINLLDDKNIHDVILFVLFGIFVILILESMYNLTLKFYK